METPTLYYKLLRKEVLALVIELRGENAVEIQKLDFKIKKASREINSCKRKISSLVKEKALLIKQKEKLAMV